MTNDPAVTAAAVQSQLAQAQLLLAETRLRCRTLLAAARDESDQILADARSAAHRIIADAHAQIGEVDVRERSAFSELWDQTADEALDGFFLAIPEREAADVYRA